MAQQQASAEVATESAEWTYTGQRLGRDGKLGYAFIDHTGTERFFGKGPKPAIVGGIYDMTYEVGSTAVWMGRARFLRLAPVIEQRNAWQREEEEARTELEARRAADRLKRESKSLGDMTLREAHLWYSKGFPTQRAGVLAILLRYLQYGS